MFVRGLQPINLFYIWIITLIYFNKNSIAVCPSVRAISGQIAASVAMTSLFESCAHDYIDSRRDQYGIVVKIDFSLTNQDVDQSDKSKLFFVPPSLNWATGNQFVFPVLSRALVIVFNVPGVRTLQLPVETIANIYMGLVTTWSDPEISKYNPNAVLPSQKIMVLARQDDDLSTVLFTNMLAKMDDQWTQTYGGPFKGPDFDNGTCCVSKKWGNVVSYFPMDIVGVVGFILSIPYSIGYATRPDVEQYNLTTISLFDDATNTTTDPTVKAMQLPMLDAANNASDAFITDNGTISVTKDNTKIAGAYPMAANSYVILNRNYKSDQIGDCCLVQELIGFFESMITPPDPNVFIDKFYVPVPTPMANLIDRSILQTITCDNQNMYTAYQSSRAQTNATSLSWAEISLIIIVSLLFLAACFVSAAYLYVKSRKRRSSSNLYVVDTLRLNVTLPGGIAHYGHKGAPDETISHAESKRTPQHGSVILSKELLFLKNTFLSGDMDENTKVNFAELPLPRGQKSNLAKPHTLAHWSDKTKALATKLRKSSSSHRNLAAFIGLTELNDGKTYTIFEYCSKGTLHYNLATCRYRLTDSIRRYLAVDVASGLEYLHTRVGVVHGQLNSLTCFLDMAWTVKIVLWDQTPLYYSESTKQGSLSDNAFTSEDCRWKCVGSETKNLLHGDNSLEALTRLVYLDPQLPTIYPQAAVDVYSFGMLLAEIFSGKLPYYDELMKTPITDNNSDNAITPDIVNKQSSVYHGLLDKKFSDPTHIRLPSMPKSTPKYVLNIIEASMRIDPTKRPTIKTILRHLSLSASDMNKGGLVDAMMETMDTYAEQLEEKVEERTAELKQVTTRMRDLLNEVLPPQIAEKLFQGVAVPPEYFECVTVYFSDIVGFTIISARSMPIQVMSFLNDLWLTFDAIIQDYDVYKVDTIGDAYMVCSGLPNRNGVEHCRQIARLALALLDACKRFKIAHLPDEKLHIRIGLNSGPVTAGVVGLKMPQYCVFGDTVNTAARMESTSLPGRIQISSTTYMLLVEHFPGEFAFEYRGEISVKGKGNMLTYWLLSSDDHSKRSKGSAVSNVI